MLTTVTPNVLPSPVALLQRQGNAHLDRDVRNGALSRVIRGVYAPTPQWTALEPWERYLARVHAVALGEPDAVFSHESAAALQGLPIFGEPPDVHITRGRGATARCQSNIRIHVVTRWPDVTSCHGVLATAPLDTTVDLARTRHQAVGYAVACATLRAGYTTTAGLFENNEQRTSSRGRAHARWALRRSTSTPESTLECVSLAAIEWLGFAPPILQHDVLTRDGWRRPDFLWPDDRVAGEADGDLKYADASGVSRLRKQRDRDAALQSAGIRAVAHWAWTDVARVDPLRAALRSAGLSPVGPEHPVSLATLAAALRGSSRMH